MEQPAIANREGAAPALPLRSRGFVFRLYTSNPFYFISADLVFIGLRSSFDTRGKDFETWALMLGLALYILLLASTACYLIRRGQVWDDTRGILLVVVMMFLAMSISFDATLTRSPRLGSACFLGGWLFAVVVSEALLRGIRLRLPFWFRLPYHLILVLFFIYPLLLTPYLSMPDSQTLQWGLFGFSTAAGLLFLSLLPAIRRGSGYVSENGSPWPWPLYPWVLYGLLAFAVVGRAYYLCISFHFVPRTHQEATNSIFAPYFLVPFLFALGILWLEAGLVRRRGWMIQSALFVPLGLVVLASVGHRPDPICQRFLRDFTVGLVGTPLYLTALSALLFYGWAIYRGVSTAWAGCVGTLLVLSVIGPGSLDLGQLVSPRLSPVLAITFVSAVYAWRRRTSWASLCAALAGVAVCSILTHSELPIPRFVVVAHLLLASCLVIGAIYRDWLGQTLQDLGAFGFFVAGLAALNLGPGILPGGLGPFLPLYELAIVGLALSYGYLLENRWHLAAGGAVGLCWLGSEGSHFYLKLKRVVAGLDQILAGLCFFLLAIYISSLKLSRKKRAIDSVGSQDF